MTIDHLVAVVAVGEVVKIDLMIDHHFTVIVHNLVIEMIEDSAVVVVVATKEEAIVVRNNVTTGNAAMDKAVEEIIVVMEATDQVLVEAVIEVVMAALEETEVVDLAVGSVEEVLKAALIHVNLKVHQEQSQKTLKSSQTISKSSASLIGLCINIM